MPEILSIYISTQKKFFKELDAKPADFLAVMQPTGSGKSVVFYIRIVYIIEYRKTIWRISPMPDREYWQRLWLLFRTFAGIAALVVGGGLAMLPVIEDTFVNRRKILTREELLDMVSLTQTVPGIIAVNSAVYVGWKVAGFMGAVCAVAGVITPSFLVILLIAILFPNLSPDNALVKGAFSGVRAAITGMIAVTAFNTCRKSVKKTVDALFVTTAFVLCALFKVNPAYVICAAMPAGLLLLFWENSKKEKEVEK